MKSSEKPDKVEKQIIEYLTKRKFKEASLTMAAYEAKQARPRGIGIDWKHYNPENDIKKLSIIFESKPKILVRLGNEKLEAVRIAAAMMTLWGKNKAKEWLPANFETGISFDNDTTARMFLFYAQHQATLEKYRKSGVVKQVEMLANSDSCEACSKLAGKRYKLNEAPELPNPNCTHELGCRCVVIPVTD